MRRKICAMERRQLTNDIQELRHIADMLIAQINANHNASSEVRQAAMASIRNKVNGVEAAHRQMESLFIENAEPARSQSLYKLSEQSSTSPEEHSRSYYHIANNSRRPSSSSNVATHPALNSMNDNRSWRSHEYVHGPNLGSVRLSDTESYL
ncbi:hypothetical protein KIN20_035703 [Parelaphostrongylus tenuis]|uniref:Uncharacterized protein n=1 Tax=Parelaphostrongylus tenuis TaxID=148309 RepID=A0AAD5WL34_PARTN|nr:hypothetical protein KIN20_035703 [Parelaphostrongylus tenuis]